MFARLFQLAMGLAAAVGWVFALVVVRSWPAVIISFLFTFLALYGDLTAKMLRSTWRYSRLKRAGFDNSCTWDMSQRGWPWGTKDFGAACLTHTATKYGWDDTRALIPTIVAFTDDHSEQHEYLRDHQFGDETDRQHIERFWSLVEGSSYSPDDAWALVSDHSYEVAATAIEMNLPLEYAAKLA